MKEKLRQQLEKEIVQIYGLGGIIYLAGMIADGLGFLNDVLNVVGVLILIVAMAFLCAIHFIWYITTKQRKKTFIVNLLGIVISLIHIVCCWYINMSMVCVSMGVFIIMNFCMIIYDIICIIKDFFQKNDDKRWFNYF